MIGAIVVAAASGPTVGWTETSVSTEASVAVEYNDNIRLAAQDARESVGRYADIRAGLFYSGPEHDVDIRPSLRAQRYTDEPSLDHDDYFFDASAKRSLERLALSMQGHYYRDTALANDIDATGLVEVGVRRERSGIAPALALDLSPRSDLKLGLGYDRVTYARGTALGSTVDYDYASASLTYIREIGQDTGIGATVSANRLAAQEIDNQASHQGVQVDYSASLSERMYAAATLGYQRSRFEQRQTQGKEKSGAMAGFRLIREGEYASTNIAFTRSVEPSGTGTLMQSDNLSLSLDYELSPVLTSSVTLLQSDRADLQGLDPGSDRVLQQVSLGLSRRLAENWSLSVRCRHTRQRYDQNDVEADGNTLTLSLSYTRDRAVLKR